MRDESAKPLRSVKIGEAGRGVLYSVASASIGDSAKRRARGSQLRRPTLSRAAIFSSTTGAMGGRLLHPRSGKKLPRERTTDISDSVRQRAARAVSSSGNIKAASAAEPWPILHAFSRRRAFPRDFLSKYPGAGTRLRPVSMDFNHGSSFRREYRLRRMRPSLMDVMDRRPDPSYTCQDMVEASWQAATPIPRFLDRADA